MFQWQKEIKVIMATRWIIKCSFVRYTWSAFKGLNVGVRETFCNIYIIIRNIRSLGVNDTGKLHSKQ